MATPPFPFDTLRARRILTNTALSGSQAEAILDVIFMIVEKSMVHKGQMSKGVFMVRIAGALGAFCIAVASIIKFFS